MTKPVRLQKKKEQNDFIQTFKFITELMKKPEFWLVILIIIIFILLIYIALMESGSNMWYNRGLIGI